MRGWLSGVVELRRPKVIRGGKLQNLLQCGAFIVHMDGVVRC